MVFQLTMWYSSEQAHIVTRRAALVFRWKDFLRRKVSREESVRAEPVESEEENVLAEPVLPEGESVRAEPVESEEENVLAEPVLPEGESVLAEPVESEEENILSEPVLPEEEEPVLPENAQIGATESGDLVIEEREEPKSRAVVPLTAQLHLLPTDSPLVIVQGLKKKYVRSLTARLALDGITMYIERGEFVVITGLPGAGKSTLLHILGCMTRPSDGEYWLAGSKVNHLSMDMLALLRNQHLGFIYQEPGLLPWTSALKNVALPLLYAGFAGAEQKRRAQKVLQAVGLSSRLFYTPERLSLGQQQRVAIARALVNSPALLLADEPIGNMDAHTGREIIAVLQALNQHNLTIILATQDADMAVYAKRHVTLCDGRIVSDELVSNTRNALADLEKATALAMLAQRKEASSDVQVLEEKP